MKINWKFITIIFLVFFISLSFVSASDLDNQTTDMSNGDIIGVDDTSNYKSFDELGKIIYGAKDGDTITLNNSYLNTNTSTIYIGKSITLDGNGFTIDGNGKTRIFTVAGNNVVLKNLKFVNGAFGVGGAISWSGNQGTIENCIFDKNTASSSSGGALFWGASNGKIINSNFTNNIAQTSGGVVSIEGDNFLIEGNIFSDNTGKLGGAIRAVGNSHRFINNEFTSNIATTSGGAIRVEGNDTIITGNTFDRNSAEGTLGGAVIALGNNINIANNKFTNNVAKRDGGAIDIEGSVSDSGSMPGINNKIENNVFTSNSATYGGAISFNGKLGTISENNFTKNHASELGGAIRWAGVSDTTGSITNNQFEENDADISGGAIFSKGNKSTITGNTFKNSKLNEKNNGAGGAMNIHGNECIIENNKYMSNTAALVGGAINYEGNNGKINKNTFDNNKATTSSGGALYISGDSNQIEENNFTKNVANGNLGGAISINGKNSNINNNDFTQNIAKTNGGAIYIKGSGSTITNNNFDSNTAENTGGALRVETGDNTKIEGNTFNKNIAKSNGGAINIEGAELSIINNKFYENQAQNDKLGGAIWFKGDGANINSNTFNGNTARTGTAINGETSGTKVVKNTFLNSEESDKTLIRLDGNNNDVSDNIYKKQDPSTKLTMNDLTVYYGGTAKLVATLTDSDSQALPDKKITINFINKNYELKTDSKGQVSIDVKDLSPNTYKATATFEGDDDYNKNTATATVTAKSTIESKDLTATYGNANYNATFLDSNGKPLAKGKYVTFTVENDNYRAQVGDNGIATATIDKGVGDYTITNINTVTGESTTNKLKITKASSTMTMNNVTFYYSGSEKLNIALTDKNSKPLANKNITLTINGKNIELSTDEKGTAFHPVTDDDCKTFGTYEATVKFAGDEDYGASQATSTVTYKTTLISDDLTAEYGNVIYNATFLSVNGTPLAKGTEVTFSTGNGDFKGKVGDNGVATATIDLNSGEYNIKSYNPSTGEFTTNKLKITKASPNLNVTVKDIEEGADAVFDITSNSQNGLVILNIDNKDYNANLEKGKTSITVSNLTNGKYPYSVKYVGDANYTEQNITGNLNVKSDDVIITAPDVTKYYKGDERLTVSLTDKAGAPLKGKVVFITINGRTYNRTTDDKGIASMALGLPSNNYTANITFKGDDEYKAVNTTCNVVIKATVIGKDLTKIEKAKVPYRATFLDSTGKPLAKGTEIQFNINGVFYKRVIGDNGEGQLNINLVAGKYTITAINTQTGENAANTVIINPRIVNNTDVTKFFKNGTQYYVTVLDDNGNPAKANESVTFNINGVLYTRQTNENGTVRMNINLPPGEYTITAEYKNCKASNEIKVLPVLSAKDIDMKYRDGTTFKANLVDGSGNPYANQNITFNINGVLYNRLTNENGTAELRINLMAGEYIITSTYNGASIANKVTIRP